jgi:hypothetical protein
MVIDGSTFGADSYPQIGSVRSNSQFNSFGTTPMDTSGFTGSAPTASSQDFTLNPNIARGSSSGGGGAGASDAQKNLSHIGAAIGGAEEAVAGFKQGGVMGGLSAGIGVYQAEISAFPELAATPVGAVAMPAIAAIAGITAALIHHDDPTKMPDKYNTQDYGQFVANMQGATAANLTNANGQQFQQDYAMSQLTGGLSEGQFIANYVKGKSSAQLSAVFGNDGSKIQQMFSQWTSQGMHDGKNGNMMIGASTYDWQNIKNLGTEAFTAISNAASNLNQALAPLISVNAYGTSGASFSPYYTPGYGSVSSLYNTPYNSNIPGAIQPIAANSFVAPASSANTSVVTNLNLDGRVVAQTVSNYRSQKTQQGFNADS